MTDRNLEAFAERLEYAKQSVRETDEKTIKEKSLYDWLKYHWDDGLLKPFIVWLVWILVATTYYGGRDGFSFCKSFYYSGVLLFLF